MTTITLTDHGQELLSKELARRPGESPERVIERALEALQDRETQDSQMAAQECRDAASTIRELRKGVTLGGLKIRDLIREGHKY